MGKYRKLIAAGVGISMLLVNRQMGGALAGADPFIVDLIIEGGTMAGVYFARNDA
jgi:hypothetical protein